jgi:hypothetical protein
VNDRSKNEQDNLSKPAGYGGLVERLPLTMRPSLNRQLSEWDALFPFEQKRAADFLNAVRSFPPAAFDSLTRPLRELEAKMGIDSSNFAADAETMGNTSLLARSQNFADWRMAVQQIFEAIEAHAGSAAPAETKRTRLILLVLPATLPFSAEALWQEWGPRGKAIAVANSSKLVELALRGGPGRPSIASLLARQGDSGKSSLWLLDADAKLNGLNGATAQQGCTLSYAALRSFRDSFLAELNTIPKNIDVSDQIIARMRQRDWNSAWGDRLAGQPRLRKFVMDVFLSGNGSLIFSNAFVEWSASEALRRARPRVLVANFGVRSEPKPFTGIAIFENQQTISSLPDVADPENSAVDAMILARYIWLSAQRYPEQEQTICVCVAESRNQVWVAPLMGSALPGNNAETVSAEDLYSWMAEQISI